MTATQTRSRFLDLRALSALAHLRFAARQRIDGTYTGRHASRQQGGAGEFVDYREYSEGEDLRRLDWRVLARTAPPEQDAKGMAEHTWTSLSETRSLVGGESPRRRFGEGIPLLQPDGLGRIPLL